MNKLSITNIYFIIYIADYNHIIVYIVYNACRQLAYAAAEAPLTLSM